MTRVFIPRDSSALSLGAESVASAVAVEAARRKADVTIVRNGSRGLYWLEPMIEVETVQGHGHRFAPGTIIVSGDPPGTIISSGNFRHGKHRFCVIYDDDEESRSVLDWLRQNIPLRFTWYRIWSRDHHCALHIELHDDEGAILFKLRWFN